MFMVEVFVFELVSIDGFTTSSVSSGEISSLNHEIWNDAMENTSFEMKRLPRFSDALLSGAKGSEVLTSFWNIFEKLESDATSSLFECTIRHE